MPPTRAGGTRITPARVATRPKRDSTLSGTALEDAGEQELKNWSKLLAEKSIPPFIRDYLMALVRLKGTTHETSSIVPPATTGDYKPH